MSRSWITRRTWLSSVIFARLATTSQADDPLGAIRERGRKAGLGEFQVSSSKEFQAIGDAPARFRADALDRCDRLAKVFRDHFTARGFEVKKPAGLLTLVTLKSPESFAAYTGRPLETALGGHYDLETNELVMFDLRQDDAKGLASPIEANNLVLIHEATHLLCFNSGVLSRETDVPLALSEGLACYGETWRPKGKNVNFGSAASLRDQVFPSAKAEGLSWIPIDRLIADDQWFANPSTQQLAYAESWLLIFNMMGSVLKREKLKKTLTELGNTKLGSGRVNRITAALDLSPKFDEELRRAARWSS